MPVSASCSRRKRFSRSSSAVRATQASIRRRAGRTTPRRRSDRPARSCSDSEPISTQRPASAAASRGAPRRARRSGRAAAGCGSRSVACSAAGGRASRRCDAAAAAATASIGPSPRSKPGRQAAARASSAPPADRRPRRAASRRPVGLAFRAAPRAGRAPPPPPRAAAASLSRDHRQLGAGACRGLVPARAARGWPARSRARHRERARSPARTGGPGLRRKGGRGR